MFTIPTRLRLAFPTVVKLQTKGHYLRPFPIITISSSVTFANIWDRFSSVSVINLFRRKGTRYLWAIMEADGTIEPQGTTAYLIPGFLTEVYVLANNAVVRHSFHIYSSFFFFLFHFQFSNARPTKNGVLPLIFYHFWDPLVNSARIFNFYFEYVVAVKPVV